VEGALVVDGSGDVVLRARKPEEAPDAWEPRHVGSPAG
jgi:hypothetical protein